MNNILKDRHGRLGIKGGERTVAPGIVLFFALLLTMPISLAANDPGHDTLYVLKVGDSNVVGSLNITNTLNASYIRAATLLYGDQLDIRANGTIISSGFSRPSVQAAQNQLFLDANGNLYLNTKSGTSSIVQVGDATNAITMNVSGTILQQNIKVCLANGTNCLTGTNTGNISGISQGTGISVTNPNGPTSTIAVDATVCRNDGTNCPAGATNGVGWTNTSGSGNVSLTNNNVNVSINTLYIDNTNGRVGIGTTNPSGKLVVNSTDTTGIMYTKSGSKDARITVGDNTTSWSFASGWASPGDWSLIEEGVAGNRLYVQRLTGNVGIGTSAPGQTFDVRGTAIINSSAGTGSFQVQNTIGASHLFINGSTGNVGIGTATPNAPITISNTPAAPTGTDGGTGRAISLFASNSNHLIGLQSGGLWMTADSAMHFYYKAGSTINERVTFDLVNSKVGIGTTAPNASLHVYGAGQATGNPSVNLSSTTGMGAALVLQDSDGGSGNGGMLVLGANQGEFAAIKGYLVNGLNNTVGDIVFATRRGALDTNLTEAMRVTWQGNVGINTTTPTQTLTVKGTSNFTSGNIWLDTANGSTTGNLYIGGDTNAGMSGMRLFGGNFSGLSGGFIDAKANTSSEGLRFRVDTISGGTERMRITAGGTVYVGTGTPGNATGAGDLYVTRHIEYDGNLYGPGADVAELINTSETVEAGDVVVADQEKIETVRKSRTTYNTAVVGIVSSDPSIILSKSKGTVPLTLSGRVPIKVSAENGAIHPGDLLTTSSTSGYAMKCDNKAQCQGAIVAKSLGTLETGTGKITGLVMLG